MGLLDQCTSGDTMSYSVDVGTLSATMPTSNVFTPLIGNKLNYKTL